MIIKYVINNFGSLVDSFLGWLPAEFSIVILLTPALLAILLLAVSCGELLPLAVFANLIPSFVLEITFADFYGYFFDDSILGLIEIVIISYIISKIEQIIVRIIMPSDD